MGYCYRNGNVYGRGDYYRGDYYRGDYYRGDPGIFGSIGKFIGGAIKTVTNVASAVTNPVGFIASAASKVLGAHPAMSTALTAPNPMVGTALAPAARPVLTLGGQGIANIGSPSFLNMNIGPAGIGGGAMVPMTTPSGQTVMVPCQVKGTHLNKSSYYTKNGYVHKGTVCVRNRHMNAGNAKALRHALRRVTGFAKLAKRSRRAIQKAATAVGATRHTRAKRAFGRK